jgi:dTDP-3-amino-3,4,6-trideoxy-alpha-D-glucose transaminase
MARSSIHQGQLIGLTDFEAQWAELRDVALTAVDRVGASGWLILGDEVRRFEQALAAAWPARHVVGCGSGLDALEIALRCAGVQPGDRVLTTPLSAFATALAIVRAGAAPVFCDVDASGLLDLERAEAALAVDPGIRALVPVHLYGHAADVRELRRLAERFGVAVVEDCAQSIGASSGGLAVGSASVAAATSFYPTKNLGALGDAGAVLCDRDDVAERARCLRDYGQRGKYVHAELGLNSRLDELHAAILADALLPLLERNTARRRAIAEQYRAQIASDGLELPPVPPLSESVWHLFPVLVRGVRAGFEQALAADGIATGRHYPFLLPEQDALADVPVRSFGTLELASAFAAREVSLPLHPYLSDEDVDRVVAACNAWT